MTKQYLSKQVTLKQALQGATLRVRKGSVNVYFNLRNTSDFSGGTTVPTNQFPFLTDYAHLIVKCAYCCTAVTAAPLAAMNSSEGKAATQQRGLHPELS